MIVNSVSPTPFSLLRRAKNFEYRDDDAALQQFSEYDDSVKALTDECRRVLECIASANQSTAALGPTTPDPTWSRFEDFGFSELIDSTQNSNGNSSNGLREFSSSQARGHSNVTDLGRPTTPSWADFLSSGFADENNQTTTSTLLLPSHKLPPLGEPARVHSSQSHVRNGASHEEDLEPGELASITQFDLDDAFWWVWMVSLANEETTERKAAFGRCTLIETRIPGAKWLVMEEQVKGAASGPEEGAYIAEKKSKFSFTRRGRLGRRKSTGKKPASTNGPYIRGGASTPSSTIGSDQHARIQAAAAKLAQKDRDEKAGVILAQRRGRMDEASSIKTNSVLTLQPHLLSEAGPAMKWDKKFGEGAKDKAAIRAQYLGDLNAGKGGKDDLLKTANGRASPLPPDASNRNLPALPPSEREVSNNNSQTWQMPEPAKKSPVPEHVAVVPWPDDSPLPTPLLPTEEKHLTPANASSPHPALRKPVPEQQTSTLFPSSTRDTHDSRASEEVTSPPEQRIAPNKLKKNLGSSSAERRPTRLLLQRLRRQDSPRIVHVHDRLLRLVATPVLKATMTTGKPRRPSVRDSRSLREHWHPRSNLVAHRLRIYLPPRNAVSHPCLQSSNGKCSSHLRDLTRAQWTTCQPLFPRTATMRITLQRQTLLAECSPATYVRSRRQNRPHAWATTCQKTRLT
jgi:hypothetical protein